MNTMVFWYNAKKYTKATAITVAYFGFIIGSAYIMAVFHLK